jgi:hypothetical protein
MTVLRYLTAPLPIPLCIVRATCLVLLVITCGYFWTVMQ